MVFDPKPNRYPYPEDTDRHYLDVKKNNGLVFDTNYPYIDTSKKFRRNENFTRFLLKVIVFPLTRIRFGLRIKGRENLKKYKDVIDKGVVSVCNHVHMWDYLGILLGIKRRAHVLTWAPNIRGENGKMLRSVGAIPIPENDMQATYKYMETVNNYINSGGWLHIYAEGSMWEYYQPIRPFKRGAAYFACENNKPVIPLAFSYRKPGWFRKVFFKQYAKFTLHIGEPIYPDLTLNRTQMEIDLTKRMHDACCLLSGVDPKDSIYKPVFNHDKRVDYYTEKYGVNYKGSW